jgi:hypothetical protein
MVVGYRGSKGRNLFRSVDVNAPLPPDYSQVPFPGSGHIEQIRSDGSMRSDALEMTFRGRVGQHLNGQIQYVLSNTRNDTRSIWWYPSDQYAPASAEWGPAEFDQRHRLNALVTITAGRWINLGISARYGSPLPFNETAGLDLFHTTLSNARPPGVTRNSLRGSSTKNVDAHWSHDVLTSGTEKDGGRTLSVALDAFNAFNHPNFSGYVGNVRSPLFRSPTVAAAGRRLQLSLEAKF